MRQKLCEWKVIDETRNSAGKTLEQHIADWKQALLAKGNTKNHASKTASRVIRLFNRSGFQYWSCITPLKVLRELANMREEGLGAKTSNYYLRDSKSFCRWMVREKRVSESPIDHLKGVNTNVDIRRERRALSVEKISCLLATSKNNGSVYGVSGKDRWFFIR